MPLESDNNATTERQWCCLRTQTKREHIAAAILSKIEGVDVFCPRISQVKKTRTGKKRFVEALFPGYIFALFDFANQSRQITYSQGVTRIVELGDRKFIPEAVIQKLKDSLAEDVIEAPDLSVVPGAEIELITGSLKGLNGKVLAQLPAKNRIEVLLEFLGREVTVTVAPDDVLLRTKED